jgi:uncharacterized protein (DUF302 family)
VKKIYVLILAISLAIFMIACNGTSSVPVKPKIIQDIQVFSSVNTDATITTKSIENAFDKLGLSVLGNNNMNKAFQQRFKKTYYKTYNLAMYTNKDLTFKLIKKYPKFATLTPLTMSIWEDESSNINISTLSLDGMARVAQIPLTDPDLLAYATLIHKALKAAMPDGDFKELTSIPAHQGKPLQVNFVAEVTLDEDGTYEDYIEDFETEFEGKLEAEGFMFPSYTNLQEEIFNEKGYTGVYDFFDTYSICKLDVIFPISRLHPEVAAWAPCSFYIYKRSEENIMRIGFLDVENWIDAVGIKDKKSIKSLRSAQGKIKAIIHAMIE